MEVAPGALLVVDDNEMNRDMLARRLARRGYAVTVAEDGHQALRLIEEQPFDLVLLDIMMPGISGLEVLKIVRERYSMADLPIIMATAKDQSADIVAALRLGANDYVTKPLDFPVVLARTQTQLALKRATEEIQRLAQQLEQHNRFIRHTFGRYLSDEVVANLLDAPQGLQLGGEKRQVTLLMSDLRGFTSLAERLAPEQVMTILNRYLGTMVGVITSYQGTIDEFIGDAIFVIFGAPIQRPDDAPRAIACAVAMQLAMDAVNAQNRRDGLPEVEMGIGIHTGDVVVGNIGSDQRAKYGVVGSPVNLTGRIESYTVGGQILISERTRQAVGPILRVAKQITVETKGVAQPITLHDVRGIGGVFNVFLPEKDETFVRLREAIPCRCTVLEGKHLGNATLTGRLVNLSARSGEVHTHHAIAARSDIKIELMDHHGATIPGDLYAKVVGSPAENRPGFTVQFTTISPEIAAFFQDVLASYAPENPG